MLLPARSIVLAAGVTEPDRKLVTVGAAKTAPSVTALSDQAVNDLILQASDAAARYCGIRPVGDAAPTFARQSLIETQVFPNDPFPPRPTALYLGMRPALVTGLLIDNSAMPDDQFVARGRVVRRTKSAQQRWFPADADIAVYYDAGYVTPVQKGLLTPPTGPDLPTEIERAVILIAQHFLGLQNRAHFDVAARVEEDSDVGRIETRYFSADRGGGIPADAAMLLAPYCEFG